MGGKKKKGAGKAPAGGQAVAAAVGGEDSGERDAGEAEHAEPERGAGEPEHVEKEDAVHGGVEPSAGGAGGAEVDAQDAVHGGVEPSAGGEGGADGGVDAAVNGGVEHAADGTADGGGDAHAAQAAAAADPSPQGLAPGEEAAGEEAAKQHEPEQAQGHAQEKAHEQETAGPGPRGHGEEVDERGSGDNEDEDGEDGGGGGGDGEEEDEDEDEEEDEDDEDEEEEEEDEEEEEEEEEEEPRLKYQRLGNSVPDILKRESASAISVHAKHLALGTVGGWIYILDFNGNELRRFGAHTAVVNDLCFDRAGEFIASCSDDGTVVMNGLYSAECESFTYQRPVKALALHANFSRKGNRQFASGGLAGQLLLNEKGWFLNKDKVVHSGEGPIYSIAWEESLIAWANDVGVKIFDNASGQRITFIDRPKGSARADLMRCSLCWETPTVLLIGWADYVKIAHVKERPGRDGMAAVKYVEIVAFFHTDFFISGLAPLNDLVVLLAYVVDESGAHGAKGSAERPELRILTRSKDELSSDALSMHGFERLNAKDYRLAYLPASVGSGGSGGSGSGAGGGAGGNDGGVYFIVSPKDMVVARPRDFDDHISWLLDRRLFGQAMEEAELNPGQLRRHKLQDIGEKYLGQLTEAREFEKAASLCPRILNDKAVLWHKWVSVFNKIGQQRAILPYIPLRNPQLNAETYSSLLLHFLDQEATELLRLIGEWPSSLYDIKALIKAANARLQDRPNDEVLLQVLAQLLVSNGDYQQALEMYLKLRLPEQVFGLISSYDLFSAVKDKVMELVLFDEPRALKMLVASTDKIAVAHVVAQLTGQRRLVYAYLDSLFDKDPRAGANFHEMQVELYADFDQSKLLAFLRQSNNYRLESALTLCEARKLYPEMVFVLTRMGNSRQALALLLEHVGDVSQAIEFCQAQEDEDLWEVLISHCLSEPKLVAPLLQDIGAHVDPLKVVKRIPKGMVIDGLREKLIKIISDYHLQLSLKEGCEQILKSDVVGLEKRLNKVQRRATRVDAKTRCALTGAPVVGGAESMLLWPYPDLVVLHGGRVFQEAALVGLTQEQPCSPSTAGEGAAGRGGGGAQAPTANGRQTGAWGAVPSPKGGAASLGAESGGAGGDGAAAARMILQRGFVVEGKHFYRDGLLHGRDW